MHCCHRMPFEDFGHLASRNICSTRRYLDIYRSALPIRTCGTWLRYLNAADWSSRDPSSSVQTSTETGSIGSASRFFIHRAPARLEHAVILVWKSADRTCG